MFVLLKAISAFQITQKITQMKFFIDTANLNDIAEAESLGILDGVTTNPSLMAKEKISGTEAVMAHYKKICAITDGDVSAEVISTDFEGMKAEAAELVKIADNIVVKIPMIRDGVKTLAWCASHGIRTNCTLVFSAGQAILAAKSRCYLREPLSSAASMTSAGEGMQLVSDIAEIYAIQGFETEILAASIRSGKHIVDAAKAWCRRGDLWPQCFREPVQAPH